VGVADVRADRALLYGSTQVPFRLREQVASITGLPADRVHFDPRAMSGGFGRHNASDATIEAARLSHAVGRPVRVQWGRGDELRAGPNRPEMTAELEAALDAGGRITGWREEIRTNPYTYDVGGDGAGAGRPPLATGSREAAGPWGSPTQMMAMMAGRNAIPPYDVRRAEITLHITPGRVRTGALRSLGASPNTFAIESFMDELARAAGQDPIAFRLAQITDPRLRRVLEAVRERSGWTATPRRKGLGVACVVYRQTCVAEVVEVSVARSGQVSVERVWCAVDPGHVVHPSGARNQVEGAIQMAASWTLLEELPHRGDEVTGSTWQDYPIATCTDAPQVIDVVFTGDDTMPSLGLGEPPAVPMAPAIANAIFDACGARVRALPIRPDAVLRALAESSELPEPGGKAPLRPGSSS
jgi:CO/xanthine dehydrogenase Mo-binding subunit